MTEDIEILSRGKIQDLVKFKDRVVFLRHDLKEDKEMKKKADEYSRHEIMDRISVCLYNLSTHVMDHEFYDENPKVKYYVDQAAKRLAEAYQEAGAWAFDTEEEK